MNESEAQQARENIEVFHGVGGAVELGIPPVPATVSVTNIDGDFGLSIILEIPAPEGESIIRLPLAIRLLGEENEKFTRHVAALAAALDLDRQELLGNLPAAFLQAFS